MLNGVKEHRKYIVARVIGSVVTVTLIAVLYVVYFKIDDFKEYKTEVLALNYEITTDKLEHYVSALDECKRTYKLLEKKYEDDTNDLKKSIKRVKYLNRELKRELEERDTLLLDTTVCK